MTLDSVGFLLKQVVGLLLQPLTIILLLLGSGLFLLWRQRRPRLAGGLLAAGTVLLLLASLQYLPFLLGRALESQYPAFNPNDHLHSGDQIRYVVVLGGGVRDDARLPLSSRLSPTALARVVEGVRVANAFPEASLVLTGGTVFSSIPEAEIAGDVAEMLGIAAERIVRERESRDTAEQARIVRDLIGTSPFVLVTSAVHMPRSMALFRAQGLNPIPAPTAHLFDGRPSRGPQMVLPAAENLRNLDKIMHEIYGLLWAQVRGQA